MRCLKCGTVNSKSATECDGCGVIFADLARERQVMQKGQAATQASPVQAQRLVDFSNIPELPPGYRSRLAREWEEYRAAHPEHEQRTLKAPDKHLRPMAEWQEGESLEEFKRRVRERVANRV